jgi:hypothetical protein
MNNALSKTRTLADILMLVFEHPANEKSPAGPAGLFSYRSKN